MVKVRKTNTFAVWLERLKDSRAKACILVRIERLSVGNPGDVKPVGEGVSEMRINFSPGYRVYYKMMGLTLVVLLIGGDKRTQSKDIKMAIELAREL